MDPEMLCRKLVYGTGAVTSDVCRKQVAHDSGY